MLTKLWNFMGSIRLSFWLLISGSIILFIGSLYTNSHFSFFQSLSQTRFQIWLSRHLFSSPELVWWTPVLFVIMGCLGLNILVCAIQRMTYIFSHSERKGVFQFFHKLTPSVIHLVFPVVLLGHLMTFTTAQWHRTPVKKGTVVNIDGVSSPLTVTGITPTHFSETSLMQNRISQTRVKLQDDADTEFILAFLHPLRINGVHLHLDMVKKRFADMKKTDITPVPEDENCDKAEVYHKTRQEKVRAKACCCSW